MMTPEIEMIGIVKSFDDLIANDHIDFSVEKGEIRALVGENGAGKTTLMRILFGLYHPDDGIVKIRGEKVGFNNPSDAINHRIGMVHQHFMLFNDLTVADNIIYGMEPKKWGFIDRKRAQSQVQELAQNYGFQIQPDARLSTLSVGERQRVEILKTLYREADIVILDEPTAVLTPQERDELFEVLRNLSEKGNTIILITHKLREVMELSDRATILRRGKVTGNVKTSETSVNELARLMVGREVYLKVDKPPKKIEAPVLSIKNLTLLSAHKRPVLDSISFDVHSGEIVGLAGVAGNGQTELIDILVGFYLPKSGSIILNGTDVTGKKITYRRNLGFSYIPEDRYTRGLAINEKISDNLAMGFHNSPPISNNGILDSKGVRQWAEQLLNEYDVRYGNTIDPASNLSGGNLQKLILAREFAHRSKFILADQPTRGVDIGATEFIYRQLIERRNSGDGILLISADLNEIISISDRILVIFAGKIVASIPANQAEEQELGLLMSGSQIAI